MLAVTPPRASFLDDVARARAMEAVQRFESHTSAELVVTVKKRARAYPEAHLVFGAVFAFAALLLLLFYPAEFRTTSMPIDVFVAFAVGYGLSRMLPPMQRLALPSRRRREAAEQAAKAAFVDQSITRTTGRVGILVYVAIFERVVVIVFDTGVSAQARRVAEDARPALEAALVRADMATFAATLERLGPAFAATMARSHDDANELPDAVA